METTRAPVLEMASVHKRYGAVRALDGLDLHVGKGEVVALLGPNGAGKTTAFELLLGLTRPTSGEVRILGGSPGGSRRNRVGVMLQGAGLPELVTVAEIVRLIGRSYPAHFTVADTLARVGLTDCADRTVTDLSGGERQRLLLALALVAGPEVLLLDEPTAAMDVESRHAFWDHAGTSVAEGATILFATHDLTEADTVADRVVVIQDGRMVADATPEELKRMVAAKVVGVTTDASVATVEMFPGIERVQVDRAPGHTVPPGMRRLLIDVTHAEDVVVPLVQQGYVIADLRIDDTDLEAAFVHLTRKDGLTPEGSIV